MTEGSLPPKDFKAYCEQMLHAPMKGAPSRRIAQIIGDYAKQWEAAPWVRIPYRERLRRMRRDWRTPIYAVKHLTRSKRKDISMRIIAPSYGIGIKTYEAAQRKYLEGDFNA